MGPDPVPIANISHTHSTATRGAPANRSRKRGNGREPQEPAVFQIGRSVIKPTSSTDQPQIGTGNAEEPARPVNLITQDGETVAIPPTTGPPVERQ